MCTLKTKLDQKTKTGYKLALKMDDKYYSIFTGIEYKVGDVEIQKTPRDHSIWSHSSALDPFYKTSVNRNPNYKGYTAVFCTLMDAIKAHRVFCCSSSVIIVKMVVSKKLMLGKTCLNSHGKEYWAESVAGKRILSIEKV